jgi:hypothetical protein
MRLVTFSLFFFRPSLNRVGDVGEMTVKRTWWRVTQTFNRRGQIRGTRGEGESVTVTGEQGNAVEKGHSNDHIRVVPCRPLRIDWRGGENASSLVGTVESDLPTIIVQPVSPEIPRFLADGACKEPPPKHQKEALEMELGRASLGPCGHSGASRGHPPRHLPNSQLPLTTYAGTAER